jgi:hypothetical protein
MIGAQKPQRDDGVTHEVALIVTPAMREAHAKKNRKPLMGDELRGVGTGEFDLGDLDAETPLGDAADGFLQRKQRSENLPLLNVGAGEYDYERRPF